MKFQRPPAADRALPDVLAAAAISEVAGALASPPMLRVQPQVPPVWMWAGQRREALCARGDLVHVVALHRAEAAGDRLDQHHRAKLPGSVEVRVELERKSVGLSDQPLRCELLARQAAGV